MLKRLRLSGFKSFADADLSIGRLTTLVGTNASGKSNIRDAFRFLHGISRGYSLAEIIGEKWGEGGVLQWRGIRGGSREALFPDQSVFRLELLFAVGVRHVRYAIDVDPGQNAKPPKVAEEYLEVSGNDGFEYWTSNLERDSLQLKAGIQLHGSPAERCRQAAGEDSGLHRSAAPRTSRSSTTGSGHGWRG